MTTCMMAPCRGAARPAPARTPFGRWKSRRDLVIALAARQGASVEVLADAHDLTGRMVRKILGDAGVKPGRPDAAR